MNPRERGTPLQPNIEFQRREEPMSDGELANLLAAFGNNEAKALTLLIMSDEEVYSRSDLLRKIISSQGNTMGWKMDSRTLFSYCQKSLSPIGLVAEEVIDQNYNNYGYTITDYGKEVGMPLAGLLLQWSLDHPHFSLYQMFGSTNSSSEPTGEESKKRAPQTRLKIFWELITNPAPTIREVDLVEQLGENQPTIGTHLKNLARNGVITYEAIAPGKPTTFYRLKHSAPSETPQHYKSEKALGQALYQVLSEMPDRNFSIEDMISILLERYPNYRTRVYNHLVWTVSSTLVGFTQQGYIEKTGADKYMGKSNAGLSNEERMAITSLLTILESFQRRNPQTIQEGIRAAHRISSNLAFVRALLTKAREASSNANATDSDELFSCIFSIVGRNPNSTVKQICESLGTDYGRKLTHHWVSKFLLICSQEGKINVRKTKAGNVYNSTAHS